MTTTPAEVMAAKRLRNSEPLDREKFDSNMGGYLHEWGLTNLGLLQLATAEQLHTLPDVAQGRVDQVTTYLDSCDHRRLRSERESLAMRICMVYGAANDVPVNVLPLYVRSCKAPVPDIKQIIITLNGRRLDTLGKLFKNHANVPFFERIFGSPAAGFWMRTFLTPLFI